MNINTTINLDDLLNSNEENSSEEVVEILKESITETAKSIEENAPLPDFDAIEEKLIQDVRLVGNPRQSKTDSGATLVRMTASKDSLVFLRQL